jgi:septal ring factor EnvC (AmiA/AmiB activator)
LINLILVTILAPCIFASAYAQSEISTEFASKLRETRETINESEAEKRRLLGSLYAINQRMKRIATDKGRLTDELLQSQDAVTTVAGAIKELEIQIEKQRKSLKIRLRALYKVSGDRHFGAIFSSRSAFEFDSALRNLKIISDRDFQLIKSYRANLVDLGRQRSRLKKQVEQLLLVEKRVQRQEKLLAKEHQAKSQLANQIDQETRNRISEIRRLRRTVAPADQEIAQLLRPSIFEKRGTLKAPVPVGQIVKDFGLHVDKQFGFKITHKGWEIQVSDNSRSGNFSQNPSVPVQAIDDGTVVFFGALAGYGETVIIDHEDHYYSVYSGLRSSEMALGQKLRRGEVFAKVERSLYFEFRHFSEPENPANWISKQSSILSSKDVKNPQLAIAEKGDSKWQN